MMITQTELRTSLAGVTYPRSKADLIESASHNGAGAEVLMTLSEVVDGIYLGFADLVQEIEETFDDREDEEETDTDS